MKTLLLLLLLSPLANRLAPSAEAAPLTIYGPYVWPADPPFFPLPQTNYFLVDEQLQHHDLSFRAHDTPMGPASGWYEFAYWSCWPERQTVAANFPYAYLPRSFFRTLQDNCQGALAPPAPARGCVRAADWFEGFEGPVLGPPAELKLKPGRKLRKLRQALGP